MKLLLDCDDVFDRLTRGPFPSGAADDAVVESHLRVCHECRELAEALRPAVDLLHNAYPGEALPTYRGEAICVVENPATATLAPAAKNKKEWSLGWQLVAASLLGVVIGVFAAGGSFTGKRQSATTAGQPNASGLAMLASLKFSEVCLPSSMSLASTERLRCCTDCHSSGAAAKKGIDVARLQLACVSCHDRSP